MFWLHLMCKNGWSNRVYAKPTVTYLVFKKSWFLLFCYGGFVFQLFCLKIYFSHWQFHFILALPF